MSEQTQEKVDIKDKPANSKKIARYEATLIGNVGESAESKDSNLANDYFKEFKKASKVPVTYSRLDSTSSDAKKIFDEKKYDATKPVVKVCTVYDDGTVDDCKEVNNFNKEDWKHLLEQKESK